MGLEVRIPGPKLSGFEDGGVAGKFADAFRENC